MNPDMDPDMDPDPPPPPRGAAGAPGKKPGAPPPPPASGRQQSGTLVIRLDRVAEGASLVLSALPPAPAALSARVAPAVSAGAAEAAEGPGACRKATSILALVCFVAVYVGVTLGWVALLAAGILGRHAGGGGAAAAGSNATAAAVSGGNATAAVNSAAGGGLNHVGMIAGASVWAFFVLVGAMRSKRGQFPLSACLPTRLPASRPPSNPPRGQQLFRPLAH
jgi:hypothetical protein